MKRLSHLYKRGPKQNKWTKVKACLAVPTPPTVVVAADLCGRDSRACAGLQAVSTGTGREPAIALGGLVQR